METTISIHDRYQVELKHRYPLQEGRGANSYGIGLFFFVPRNLGVNPQTYTKAQFYGDLQSYIRIGTPSIPLKNLDGNEGSPLGRLTAVLAATAKRPSDDPPADYEAEIKLFCCVLKGAVRSFVSYIKETSHAEDRDRLVLEYVQTVQNVVTRYRALRATIQTPGTGPRTLDIYLFGDEYISLLLEDYSYHLMDVLPSNPEDPAAGCQQALSALIEAEVTYRGDRGYPSVPDVEGDNETLVFRRSVLKKYMASILFLDAETKKEGQLLEQTLLGLAAGVAMVFATAVAFLSQSIYGSLTVPFFVALVLSYIFKDRIKDLLRLYLSRRVGRRLFDHKIRVHDAARNVVGICRECIEFLPRRKVPPVIRDLRDRDHITEIESGWLGERVLLYRKRIRLNARKVRRTYTHHKITSITDIMRFNIQEFLRRMDDPKKELFVMDDEGYSRIKGARVYHLNLVVMLEHEGHTTYARHRIILSRKGIKRIEQVNDAAALPLP